MPERGNDRGTIDNIDDINPVYRTPRDIHHVSRTVLRSEQAKRWTKRYRTEVAASSSSLLSTFVAVSPTASPWTCFS